MHFDKSQMKYVWKYFADDQCPYGDAVGVVYNQLTCKQIVSTQPNECLRQTVKQKCCKSCKTAQTTAVPADAQCKDAVGSHSYLCRVNDL